MSARPGKPPLSPQVKALLRLQALLTHTLKSPEQFQLTEQHVTLLLPNVPVHSRKQALPLVEDFLQEVVSRYEEVEDSLTKSVHKRTRKRGSISPPMPPKEVEHGDHLTKHVNDLQSQARLGSERRERPIPYPHENVVFHVAHLRQETLEKQVPPAGSGVIKGHLMTLAEASQTSGIPVGTLRNYLHEGKLTARGREFAPAPGGGKVLVDAQEVGSLPRRLVGRPKKNPTTAVTNPS
jgi:hypothetical protein